jgi:hypothetical protein
MIFWVEILTSKIQKNNLEFESQLSSQIISENENLKPRNSNIKCEVWKKIF